MDVYRGGKQLQAKPFCRVHTGINRDALNHGTAQVARPAVINTVYNFDGFVNIIPGFAVAQRGGYFL